MTDYQYKSILEMVKQILNRAEDLEDAKKAIEAIQGGKPVNKENE